MKPYSILTDHFGRQHDYLRISVTDACNLRCTYCMPSSGMSCLPSKEIMSPPEISEIASAFVKAGINKIRLTGGEPLVRKDFTDVLQRLSRFPVELAITTNGIYADRFMDSFKKAGLRSVNVSLDSLNPITFYSITKKNLFSKVYSNIQLMLREDFNVKVNIVVMKGINDEEILPFIELTKDSPVHIRFIEFMPFAGNQWQRTKIVSYREILNTISSRYDMEKLDDSRSDTAKKYKVKNYCGTFAVISAVSEPFCSNCNRLRITADGKMRNCLFSSEETDLLTALREGNDILPLIRNNILKKAKERGGHQIEHALSGRTMVKIGG